MTTNTTAKKATAAKAQETAEEKVMKLLSALSEESAPVGENGRAFRIGDLIIVISDVTSYAPAVSGKTLTINRFGGHGPQIIAEFQPEKVEGEKRALAVLFQTSWYQIREKEEPKAEKPNNRKASKWLR